MLNNHNTMFGAVTQILADTGELSAPFTVAPVAPLAEAQTQISEIARFTESESRTMGELVTHVERDGNHAIYAVANADQTLGYVWVWTHADGSIDRVYAHTIVGG